MSSEMVVGTKRKNDIIRTSLSKYRIERSNELVELSHILKQKKLELDNLSRSIDEATDALTRLENSHRDLKFSIEKLEKEEASLTEELDIIKSTIKDHDIY
jgi:chromosome segregation ATPase